MSTDNEIYSTTVQNKKKYAMLRQLDFNKTYLESKIEEEIADHERLFKELNERDEPTRWYYVQMELGELYRRLNLKVKRHTGRYGIEVMRSKIDLSIPACPKCENTNIMSYTPIEDICNNCGHVWIRK